MARKGIQSSTSGSQPNPNLSSNAKPNLNWKVVIYKGQLAGVKPLQRAKDVMGEAATLALALALALALTLSLTLED